MKRATYLGGRRHNSSIKLLPAMSARMHAAHNGANTIHHAQPIMPNSFRTGKARAISPKSMPAILNPYITPETPHEY